MSKMFPLRDDSGALIQYSIDGYHAGLMPHLSKARIIAILESHLKTYSAGISQIETDLLYIDTAALEEIRRL